MTRPQAPQDHDHEMRSVAERYARRAWLDDRYSPLRPDVWQSLQERQRAMLKLFGELGWSDLAAIRLLEVGCGTGGNLLELLRLGFAPEQLAGIDLLGERVTQARRVLPAALRLDTGDATAAAVPDASLDVVYAATVFSSLLDDGTQQRLADAMWRWVRPGGGVLWYDFAYDNPRNADVRGVPLKRVGELFAQGTMRVRRVTLAPPIARTVCRLHPAAYTLFNAVPLLRSHLLAWIGKPDR
jgi:SAM-dependent methyltransferase